MNKEIFGIVYLLLGIAGITCGLNWIVKTVFTQLNEYMHKRNAEATDILKGVLEPVAGALTKMVNVATADMEASNERRKESYEKVREYKNEDDFEL